MKRCPYCWGEHHARGRFCCEGHAKASARHDANVRDGRERAIVRILRRVHAKAAAA